MTISELHDAHIRGSGWLWLYLLIRQPESPQERGGGNKPNRGFGGGGVHLCRMNHETSEKTLHRRNQNYTSQDAEMKQSPSGDLQTRRSERR